MCLCVLYFNRHTLTLPICLLAGEFCALTNTNTPICDCENTRLTLAGSPGLGNEGGCCYENQDCESNLECIGQGFFRNGTLIRTPGLNVPRGTCGTEIPEEDDLGKCRSNNECSIRKYNQDTYVYVGVYSIISVILILH